MIAFGLDVSKGYANVGIINNDGNQLKEPFLIDDTKKGHKILEENINWALSIDKEGIIKIGMESSGGYESNFLNFCFELQNKSNILVYHLNPLSVRKFIEMDLHRAKNDDLNAVDIARYLKDRKEIKPTIKTKIEIQGLKEIIKTIERDVKDSTKFKNILQMDIQKYFPELLKFCNNGINDWVLKLLSKYPTAEDVKASDVKSLSKIPYITEERAKEIIKSANESIAVYPSNLTKISIKQMCKKILQAEESITELKKELTKEYEKLTLSKISSIYGIGDYTAVVITAFTGNIDNFPDVSKYVAFFGLDPRINDSGDEIKRRKITKKGSPIVRKVLYTSVLVCIGKDGHPIKKMYDRLKSRGIHHYSAATACMKKLLSIVFGILKSGKDFDINYEDSKKSEEQSIKSFNRKILKMKKDESLDTDAPISKKERTRRKKIAVMSQKLTNLSTRSNTAEYNNIIKTKIKKD